MTRIAEVVEALKAARALIEKPENWCTMTYARNKAGNAVNVTSPDACQFCALGAAARTASCEPSDEGADDAAGLLYSDLASALRVTLAMQNADNELFGFNSVSGLNDEGMYGGHGTVLRLYDRTIERLEKQLANRPGE